MIIRSKHFQYPIKKQHKQEKILKELGLTDAFELSHDPFITSSPCHCFVCEEKLTIPAIMWNGFEPWNRAACIQ